MIIYALDCGHAGSNTILEGDFLAHSEQFFHSCKSSLIGVVLVMDLLLTVL